MRIDNKVDLKDVIKNAFVYIGKKELHVNEITRYVKDMVKEFNEIDIDTLRKKVNTVLASDVKLKTKSHTFERVKNGRGSYKKGLYSLYVIKEKENPINPDSKKNKKNEKGLFDSEQSSETKNKVYINSNIFNGLSTQQIGKSGEYAVVSELLFRGFNATPMTVDDGVDIAASVASKGKFFFIQVKTTSCINDSFETKIDKDSYARYNMSNMYYIIVIRFIKDSIPINQYLIFNSYDIEKMVSRDLVGNNQNTYTMRFKMWNGGIYIVRQGKDDDVTFHLNNWSWIK